MTNYQTYRSGFNNTADLMELHLYGHSGQYYLSAKYRVENEKSVREIDIPKISLGVMPDYLSIKQEGDGPYKDIRANLGFGWLPLEPSGRMNAYFTETVLEEKTHEMTLEEIEKKLGYKVKIVSKVEARDDDWLDGLNF